MRKFIDVGTRVLVLNTDQISLARYIGSMGVVTATRLYFVPTSAQVLLDDGSEASFYLKNLESLPPIESPFQRGDSVIITTGFKKTRHHIFSSHLLKKLGEVVSYDCRDATYFVDCKAHGRGWFPIWCLRPLEFQGDVFYYPGQEVTYEGRSCIIQEIKASKSNLGQVVYIEGNWVPSSSVKVSQKP